MDRTVKRTVPKQDGSSQGFKIIFLLTRPAGLVGGKIILIIMYTFSLFLYMFKGYTCILDCFFNHSLSVLSLYILFPVTDNCHTKNRAQTHNDTTTHTSQIINLNRSSSAIYGIHITHSYDIENSDLI